MRDYEAISMNKVLITNNDYIKNFNFYNENKVIFVNNLENEIYKILDFNQKEEWNNKNDYSLDSFINWIVANVK